MKVDVLEGVEQKLTHLEDSMRDIHNGVKIRTIAQRSECGSLLLWLFGSSAESAFRRPNRYSGYVEFTAESDGQLPTLDGE